MVMVYSHFFFLVLYWWYIYLFSYLIIQMLGTLNQSQKKKEQDNIAPVLFFLFMNTKLTFSLNYATVYSLPHFICSLILSWLLCFSLSLLYRILLEYHCCLSELNYTSPRWHRSVHLFSCILFCCLSCSSYHHSSIGHLSFSHISPSQDSFFFFSPFLFCPLKHMGLKQNLIFQKSTIIWTLFCANTLVYAVSTLCFYKGKNKWNKVQKFQREL